MPLSYSFIATLHFWFPAFLLHLFPFLPLRTSEDECGNRDWEVLGQPLGAADRMHWAVVGGAASVGKGRPGPISRKNESERERKTKKKRERKTKGRYGHERWETSKSKCWQKGRKRCTQEPTQHNIAVEWKRETKKEKNSKKRLLGFFVKTPTFCTVIQFKVMWKKHENNTQHSVWNLSLAHIQSRDVNTRGKKGKESSTALQYPKIS